MCKLRCALAYARNSPMASMFPIPMVMRCVSGLIVKIKKGVLMRKCKNAFQAPPSKVRVKKQERFMLGRLVSIFIQFGHPLRAQIPHGWQFNRKQRVFVNACWLPGGGKIFAPGAHSSINKNLLPVEPPQLSPEAVDQPQNK